MDLGSAIQRTHLRGKVIHPRVAILWRDGVICFVEGSAAERAVAAKAGVETINGSFIFGLLLHGCFVISFAARLHLERRSLIWAQISTVWWH